MHDYANWGVLALRIALGVIFVVHGLPKLKNPAGIASGIGMPSWFGVVIGLFETLGGLAVLFGLFTQFGALAIAIVMVGAIYHKIVKWHVPFTAMDKMGWEFDLILLGAALLLLCTGPGMIALESWMVG